MATSINYPSPGCVVEYLENNSIQIALVLEEAAGKARLLLPNRRETRMSVNRLLPWLGPLHSSTLGREEAVRLLESHKVARENLCKNIDPLEVWELATGEIEHADAAWFADLYKSGPDADHVAAFGRSLLGCKTHFRYQSPDFTVFSKEEVSKRLEEQQQKANREALIGGGTDFLHFLWNLVQARKVASEKELAAHTQNVAPDVLQRLERLLHARVVEPETRDDENLWQQLAKGLPDLAHVPFQLLVAWGKLEPHYNFWLDRADFEAGDEWWQEFGDDVRHIIAAIESGACVEECALQDLEAIPFISIDGPTTRDIDDAFHIESTEAGATLYIALACPALAWPFNSAFDKKIMHRATSLYLPEATMHMLPEALGTDAFSLLAGKKRPSFCLRISLDAAGQPVSVEPMLASVRLRANLVYEDVQRVLSGEEANSATPYLSQLQAAAKWADQHEQARIESGAVIMQRPEQEIVLHKSGDDVLVEVLQARNFPEAQRLVAEMMVLASSALADWCAAKNIPLVHRTQSITLPAEYAGKWHRPEDLARIMKNMMPSILEVPARPHAALGVQRYAPVTSPLRRYADLLNEAQVVAWLRTGQPRWTSSELQDLLDSLVPSLEAVSQVQRFGPRYWKLVYFRQEGDQKWWPGVVTEENDNYVSVSLPEQGIFVRGRRHMFDDRLVPGMELRLRLGKVHPLYNEIQIMEVRMPEEVDS